MKMWLRRALPLILVLLYILSPLDLVPDFLVGPGWVDDLLLIGALIWFLTARRPGESPGDFYRRYRRYKRPSSGQGEGRYEGQRDRDASSGHEEEDPFKILGIEPGASPDEIKAAYRRAVTKYHPDKVTHLGKEFQEMAHRKLLAIRRAYEALMKK
ncbi:MAG: DnaJ domain-containing protein [Thermodesulfobacteriota bacterium]